MSDADCTIFDCPQCQSERAGIIRSDPPRAKCADCGATYDIATLPPTTDPDYINPLKLGRGKDKQKRKARPGVRHRRDNGPAELEVEPVAPPTPAQLGTLHLHTEDIIGGGADALLKTHRRAAKLAHLYGEEFVGEWRLKTKWLTDLETSSSPTYSSSALSSIRPFASITPGSPPSDPPNPSGSRYEMAARNRACVRYALMWRPTFLAVVALSYEILIGCKAAGVSHMTVARQRKADPDFDAQVIAAQAHCISLLHAMSMRSAIEGECEPVFWQGIEVGHIKKFDNRLRIELLRAHLPSKFKTPGSGQPLIAGDNNKVVIFDAAKRAEMVAARQEALEAMNPPPVNLAPNGAKLDSGNSPGVVQ